MRHLFRNNILPNTGYTDCFCGFKMNLKIASGKMIKYGFFMVKDMRGLILELKAQIKCYNAEKSFWEMSLQFADILRFISSNDNGYNENLEEMFEVEKEPKQINSIELKVYKTLPLCNVFVVY